MGRPLSSSDQVPGQGHFKYGLRSDAKRQKSSAQDALETIANSLLVSLPHELLTVIVSKFVSQQSACGNLALACKALQHIAFELIVQTSVTGPKIAQQIQSCPNLKHIKLVGPVFLEELKSLAQATNLRELDLSKAEGLSDAHFKVIGRMTKLTHLNVAGYSQGDDVELSHLRNLTRLNFLDLSNWRNTTDTGLENLKNFVHLKELKLAGLFEISDQGLEHLSNLPELVSLVLNGCDKIKSLDALNTMVKLKNLSLCDCIELVDFKVLKKMPQLVLLDLSGCEGFKLDTGEQLGKLTELKVLHLTKCNGVSPQGLETLVNNKNLQTLFLADCEGLTDQNLGKLVGLEKLTYLDLSENPKLTDIACLSELKALREVDVYDCIGLSLAAIQALQKKRPSLQVEHQ